MGQETRGKTGIRLFSGHTTRFKYRYGLGINVKFLGLYNCVWLDKRMTLGQNILKHSVAKGHDNVNTVSNISETNGERIKQMGQNINHQK